MLIKMIVYGIIFNGNKSYLLQGWNILDCIIVFVSIACIVIEESSKKESVSTSSNLELIKLLRILRSIRLISRSEGLKLSVISMINSFPGIIRVTIIAALCFLIFGIFFQSIFKGQFFYCHFNKSMMYKIDKSQIETMYDCVNSGGIWRNSDFNFDSILSSTFTFFVMSTDDWMEPMNKAVDSTAIGL